MGAVILGRRSRSALVLVVLALAGLSAGAARADNLPYGGGCYVTGDVDGYPQFLDCTYEAHTSTQTVYAATPNHWKAYVWREESQHTLCFDEQTQTFYDCIQNVAVQVILGEGYGMLLLADGSPRTPGPIEIHPTVGETVHIEMYGDCHPLVPTTCGKLGVVGAYE